MALFKVNTGLRVQEVRGLKWEYEVKVPELEASVFVIQGRNVKNGEERLVVLNRVAKSVVESLRSLHPVNVFARVAGKDAKARPLTKIYNTAWKAARERAADAWEQEHKQTAPAGFRSIRFTTSGIASAGDCGRLVCHSKIVSTCWEIIVVTARRTTLSRNARA